MSVRVPDERLDELAASIESMLRRPGQPVADHFRAASAAASLAALVADLRAAMEALKAINALDDADRVPDFDVSPSYWRGISEAAHIARAGLGE